jgi:hypothetical protein
MSGGGRPTFTLWQIFAAPIGIGAVSALGLTTALVGDALWDAASWLCLSLPVTVALWFGRSRGGRG